MASGRVGPRISIYNIPVVDRFAYGFNVIRRSLPHGLGRFGPGERGLQRILRGAQIGEISLRALHRAW